MHPRKIVKNGIDHTEALQKALTGKRLALITGPTGVNGALRSTVSVLRESCRLVRLFAPEHGLRGEAQAGDPVEGYTDSASGLTVHSLYQGHHGSLIAAELLADIDAVVFDMQDVGARFYTFLYTLTDAMKACAAAGGEMIVLDRVNPLGLSKVEGTVLDENFASFVGRYAVPTRYALTIGEFASYINAEKSIGCQLRVVPCMYYDRTMLFTETGLCWVLPSPNMPSAKTALAYIGTCLFEGTNLSEGRGTVKPFEMIGAPWMNAQCVIDKINREELSGVKLGAVCFKPAFSKHQNELCEGVQLHITDPDAFEPFKTGLYLLQAIRETHEAFTFLPPVREDAQPFITYLLGCDDILQESFDTDVFIAAQREPLTAFQQKSAKYYLY